MAYNVKNGDTLTSIAIPRFLHILSKSLNKDFC